MIKISNKRRIPLGEFISVFLFFAVFFGITFCIFTVIGIGFLSFLGFEYKSLGSVLIFFLIYFCITTPIDFLCTTILDIFRYVNKLPYSIYKFCEFIIDFILTFLAMNIIDTFMDSITIPLSTEILFALLSYLLSECMDFFDKDKKKS
nr:regulatory YrvL family protein [Clostridioides difficile]